MLWLARRFFPRASIRGIEYVRLLTDHETQALVAGTIDRALAAIESSGREFEDVIREGLKVIIAVDRRRRRSRLAPAVNGYFSEFDQYERSNEVLLALNLLWAANCCRRYNEAHRRGIPADWDGITAESSAIQTAFAKTRPNGADWLEYINRSNR